MKKVALVVVLFALTLGLSAQNLIDFGSLPSVNTPTPVPIIGNYHWGGIYYVNPWLWPAAGPGFKHQEFIRNFDVAFIPYTCVNAICAGSISSSTPFVLRFAHIAAGYPWPTPSQLFVIAYNNGKYVGSITYNTTTQVQQIVFPAEWGAVTQVMFQGDVVFFDLNVEGPTPRM